MVKLQSTGRTTPETKLDRHVLTKIVLFPQGGSKGSADSLDQLRRKVSGKRGRWYARSMGA